MGAQAEARRTLGLIVALVVLTLVAALWLWRDDTPFAAALIAGLFLAMGVLWVVAYVLVAVAWVLAEVLPGLAKFLRDLSGKNG